MIGQIAVTQAFLPLLRAAGGRVVNVGAASGRVTVPMLGPISASKTALESLTDALRMELKHQGVRVSIVEAATEALAAQKPSSVDVAVKAIVSAVTDRRPDSRYVVGRDASRLAMLRHVPEGLRDRLLMSTLGLKREVFPFDN